MLHKKARRRNLILPVRRAGHAAPRLFRCLALAAIIGIPCIALAASNDGDTPLPSAPDIVYEQVNAGTDPESVYRIELLVFADASERHANDENFDQRVSLGYPESALHLFEHEAVASAIEQKLFDLEQLTATSLDDIVGSTDGIEPGTLTFDDATEDTASTQGRQDRDTEKPAPIPLLQVKNIDSIKSETSRVYKTLNRRSRYRTLYHASWYQSLTSRAAALPVVITGGRQIQDRFELEGTIKISKDRFLHIQPELWLIDWVLQREPLPWYQRNTDDWRIADIPAPPNAHTVVEALDDKLARLSPDTYEKKAHQRSIDIEQGMTTVHTGYKSEVSIAKRYQTAARYLDVAPGNVDRRVDPGNADDLYAATLAADSASSEKELVDLIPPTPARVYRLAEKRRVKRDEVHYFDHPLFGVIISVSRWPVDAD